MRRRHIRHLQAEPERHTLLFVAAGAIAGAAAGLYLGRRYRSVDAFLDDVRSRLDDVRLAWQEEGEDLLAAATQRVDEVVDDVIDDDDVDDEGEGGWVEEYGHPARASSSAMPLPMPRSEPVTRAVLP
jgi:hypothetical protein